MRHFHFVTSLQWDGEAREIGHVREGGRSNAEFGEVDVPYARGMKESLQLADNYTAFFRVRCGGRTAAAIHGLLL